MSIITKPGIIVLSFFGLFICLVILILFYIFSLPFFNMFGFTVTIYVVFPLILFLLLTIKLDQKFKIKLKRYAILAIVVFTFCVIIFPTTKKWIIGDAERKGEVIVNAIKDYKLKYGWYPNSLEDPFFKTFTKTAIINRPFFYEIIKDEKKDTTFIIFCYSFDGYKAARYSDALQWYYED